MEENKGNNNENKPKWLNLNEENKRKVAGAAIGVAVTICVMGGGIAIGSTMANNHPSTASPSQSASSMSSPSSSPDSAQAQTSIPMSSTSRSAASRQASSAAASSNAANEASITFDVGLDGFKSDDSTPLLAKVKGKTKDGKEIDKCLDLTPGERAVKFPYGEYTVSFATAVNPDGSIYKTPNNVQITLKSDGSSVNAHLDKIEARDVTASQVNEACNKISRFVYQSAEYEGDGAATVRKAYANGENAPAKKRSSSSSTTSNTNNNTSNNTSNNTNNSTRSNNNASSSSTNNSNRNNSSSNARNTSDAVTDTSESNESDEAAGTEQDSKIYPDSEIPTVKTTETEEEKAPTSSASMVWVNEKGHFESQNGKPVWVVDEEGHWEQKKESM